MATMTQFSTVYHTAYHRNERGEPYLIFLYFWQGSRNLSVTKVLLEKL